MNVRLSEEKPITDPRAKGEELSENAEADIYYVNSKHEELDSHIYLRSIGDFMFRRGGVIRFSFLGQELGVFHRYDGSERWSRNDKILADYRMSEKTRHNLVVTADMLRAALKKRTALESEKAKRVEANR